MLILGAYAGLLSTLATVVSGTCDQPAKGMRVPEIQEVLPKYLQIAGYLRDQIVRGDLRPGQEVPSERELAAQWKVARPTATKALDSLRVQGLVESRQGAGTFVRSKAAAPRARERYERAAELGTMYADDESVEFMELGVVAGDEQVLQALQLPSGSEVLCRARIIHHQTLGPIELSTSWFPGTMADVAPALLQPERLRGGTAKYLQTMTGRSPSYARDQVSARLATALERRRLKLPRPAAVLDYWLTVFDEDDAPLQFDTAVYPQARWAFRQEYPLSV
jgi:DNA-binding GntR family transcriptional regulator